MFDRNEATDRIIDRVMQAPQVDRPDILREILACVHDDEIEAIYGDVLGDDPPQVEDDDEPTEPEEGDWVTKDYITFYAMSERGTLRVKPGERWQDVVSACMKKDSFLPNVWALSDHGNWNLLRLEDK